jgi:hypothetical protein
MQFNTTRVQMPAPLSDFLNSPCASCAKAWSTTQKKSNEWGADFAWRYFAALCPRANGPLSKSLVSRQDLKSQRTDEIKSSSARRLSSSTKRTQINNGRTTKPSLRPGQQSAHLLICLSLSPLWLIMIELLNPHAQFEAGAFIRRRD